MIILITGASHTGKTLLAQRLLEQYHYPYLSIDHLKMGLIRSGMTELTPLSSDEELTQLLWPIVRKMIKTAIENHQNLTVEGCYIPPDWEKDFDDDYLGQIRCCCLIMSERYICRNFDAIKAHANAIEARLDDTGCTVEALLRDNAAFQRFSGKRNTTCIFIDRDYEVSPRIFDTLLKNGTNMI